MPQPSNLRVLSFNLRRLRDDRGAVRQVLRDARPDVVAIQEPTRGPVGRWRLRRLAAEADLTVVSGGGGRTTALLVRRGAVATGARSIRLSSRPGRTRRGASLVDLSGVRVMSVHLGLDARERRAHVDRLLLAVRSAPGPVVVAGDLNESPGGGVWNALTRHLRDVSASSGPTYPSAAPRHRIDVVMVAGGLHPLGVEVRRDEVARAASDHLPVLVELSHGVVRVPARTTSPDGSGKMGR